MIQRVKVFVVRFITKHFIVTSAICFGSIFFLIGFVTLSHYGLNLDEAGHYWRGHSYLHFFLTGKHDYTDIPHDARRSVYQHIENDGRYGFDYWLTSDSGHPVINGIFAALFNVILYQKLGIVPDLEAHHIFTLLVSSIGVGAVVWFVSSEYGVFAGLVSGLSFSFYPLFFGESRFNIKDPVETTFYTLTILLFYLGITKAKHTWILASAVFAGLGLGTKFNIFFTIPTIGIWLFFVRNVLIHLLKKKDRKFLFSLVTYPVIAWSIFFFSWPYLWSNPIKSTLAIFGYYKEIGYGTIYQSPEYFTKAGINTYGLQWIIYTTPIIILLFTCIGIFFVLKKGISEKYKISLLVFFWFVIPIARITVPKAGIYGGVRQIMEYIPAMAMLSGIGAWYLINFFKKGIHINLARVVVLLLFIPIAVKLISLHPNENVYMNPLVGGLSGARAKNLDHWGNTFGNVYRQGVWWMNKNAKQGSTLALGGQYEENLLRVWLRPDIQYSNDFRSGFDRKGEFVLEMTSDNAILPHLFYLTYVKNFLIPVHEVRVEAVPVLTIWKNDDEHTKPEYLQKEEADMVDAKNITVSTTALTIKLDSFVTLTGMTIEFADPACTFSRKGYFRTSDTKTWTTHPGDLEAMLFFPQFNPRETFGQLSYLFAGERTKEIAVVFEKDNTCLQHPGRVTIRRLVL